MKRTSEQNSYYTKCSNIIVGITALIAFILLMFERTTFVLPWRSILKDIDLTILLVFLLDVVLRILFAKQRIVYLKNHWIDLAVLIPLLQLLWGITNSEFYVIAQLSVVILMLISRTRRTKLFASSQGFKPARLMITCFFLTICTGTILLSLPAASTPGKNISILDALFTSTSAMCVTGLTVVDTATQFSIFGQLIILLLVQLGGLGIMTFTVFLAVLLGRRVGINQRIVMHDVLDRDELSGAVHTISFIVKMTVFLELAGAIALSILWYPRLGSIKSSIYHGIFHSVSAFCNAGFSTFSDGLMSFASDTGTNVVICLMIISGGLGFMAIRDILDTCKSRITNSHSSRPRLRIQTLIIITVTVLLIIIGSLGIFVFEADPDFFGSNPQTGILRAVFQSISSRSAGFNTCDISHLSPATLFLMMLLMFIGGSPGSTSGGIKTTTFAVLWRTMTNGFSQNKNVVILRRTIPHETIQKATTLLLFYIGLLSIFIMILLAIEDLPMIDLLFEIVSAGTTVGLSTGITSKLSEPGRILIMVLMFIGRLGLLTIGYALVLYQRKANYTYAEERVMIG